ncbi:MAG TPA: toll/interleukin-1 receptor domain-containing protein [Pyrinomonadaceae bacterium]
MDKPRVFISHSTTKDPEAAAVRDALSAALKDKFAVRVDKEHLKLGEGWRHTLNTWIGGCDAAVVLLSKDALESQFVAYEASILTFRHNIHGLPVVPLYFGVGGAEVRGSQKLKPTNIAEIQSAVSGTDTAQMIEQVVAHLAKVTGRDKTPIDRQVRRLEELLGSVGESLIVDDYLPMLDYTSDPWEREDNPRRLLAIEMMSAGIEGAEKVLREIRGTLMREEKFDEVFELVATSWVDLRAASRIKEVATGEQARRAIALEGENDLITKFYVLRASGQEAGNSWKMVRSLEFFSENPLEDLKREVAERLRREFKLPESGDLEKMLDIYDRRKEPVVVAIASAGLGPAELAGLRDAFKTVTFFYLAGENALSRDVLTQCEVEFIVPSPGEGLQKNFCDFYEESKLYLFS